MIALVKYTARRDKDLLETISREVVEVIPGDLEEEYSDLVKIILPSIKKMLGDQEAEVIADEKLKYLGV
ncbi:hypothetical protein SAMN02745133_03092 [Desulforamulus putei DSM 12395]|uniref:Uncharacterized protein n=1 Tax=Desulforamulus putei DSM 12395 TaxID=1121429 RepID=A0A1M5D2Y1_9FIRM|nr:hypothetical protein [Desulforamulus putei]SHF61217.1 hypothetical protein SAMN02745133_03092 [Desulforamulus putei DSM 12395]